MLQQKAPFMKKKLQMDSCSHRFLCVSQGSQCILAGNSWPKGTSWGCLETGDMSSSACSFSGVVDPVTVLWKRIDKGKKEPNNKTPNSVLRAPLGVTKWCISWTVDCEAVPTPRVLRIPYPPTLCSSTASHCVSLFTDVFNNYRCQKGF